MSVMPDIRERDLLQFHVAKDLAYAKRVGWAVGLVSGAILLETVLPWPWQTIGLPLLFGAGILLAGRGYTNKPPRLRGEGLWRATGTDRLDQILNLNQRGKAWDVAALDISNVFGCVCLLAAGGLTAIAGLLVGTVYGPALILVPGSAVALLLPIWVTGHRAAYSNKDVVFKAKLLRALLADFEQVKHPGEEIQAILKLRGKEDRAIPEDIKLQVSWKETSPDFYGVQCQVNINTVQGNRYPYCYCVVVARRGLGIFDSAEGIAVPKEITVECQQQGDVDVIVIRQHTTKQSGYHTKPDRCRQLLENALLCGRRIARDHPR